MISFNALFSGASTKAGFQQNLLSSSMSHQSFQRVSEGESPLSSATDFLLNRISQSPLLTRNDKNSFIRLTSMVEEFTDGADPKLLEKIGAVISMTEIMNQGREQFDNQMSYSDALSMFFRHHQQKQQDAVSISLEVELKAILATQKIAPNPLLAS